MSLSNLSFVGQKEGRKILGFTTSLLLAFCSLSLSKSQIEVEERGEYYQKILAISRSLILPWLQTPELDFGFPARG